MKISKKIALVGLCAATAIAAGYFERFIPISFGVPGIKLGLANVAVLFALYALDTRSAFGISLVRILVGGVAFGGVYGLLYSLAGGLLSFGGMAITKQTNRFSPIGVSMLGGVLHNWGQIAIAAFVVRNIGILRLSPILTLAGMAAGALTGLAATMVLHGLAHNGVVSK